MGVRVKQKDCLQLTCVHLWQSEEEKKMPKMKLPWLCKRASIKGNADRYIIIMAVVAGAVLIASGSGITAIC